MRTYQSKAQLVAALKWAQRGACGYDRFEPGCEHAPNAPGMCDCKYGLGYAEDFLKDEESTGCPELREAAFVLDAMTDEEFTEIAGRALAKAQIAQAAAAAEWDATAAEFKAKLAAATAVKPR